MAIVPILVSIWQLAIFAFELTPEATKHLRYFGLSRRSFWELIFGLVALSIIVVSVEGAYRAIRKQEQSNEHLRKLALTIQHGHSLREQCADIYSPTPIEQIEGWTIETQSLLDRLGHEYVEQFRKPIVRKKPITIIETQGTISKNINSREHYDQWKQLGYRLERLEQYLAKLLSN